jgi:hypothetical protein
MLANKPLKVKSLSRWHTSTAGRQYGANAPGGTGEDAKGVVRSAITAAYGACAPGAPPDQQVANQLRTMIIGAIRSPNCANRPL